MKDLRLTNEIRAKELIEDTSSLIILSISISTLPGEKRLKLRLQSPV
jgi:hypothetical protein